MHFFVGGDRDAGWRDGHREVRRAGFFELYPNWRANVDPRLTRLEWTGQARYMTRDRRFTIEQGGNEGGSWTIYQNLETDHRLLAVSEADRAFNTLREAREWLTRSTYDWIGRPDEEIESAYQDMIREPVSQ
jgi:hypothetical protein